MSDTTQKMHNILVSFFKINPSNLQLDKHYVSMETVPKFDHNQSITYRYNTQVTHILYLALYKCQCQPKQGFF